MKRINKTLQKFGLTDNEISVYLACLKEDDQSPYTIAKTTKIPRTTVYDILMNLSLKGLVELQQSDGFTKQQTRVTAKNPSVLRKILQRKSKDIIKLETEVLDILPFLKKDFHKDVANADFRFYPGIKGFKEVYLDTSMYEMDVPRYSWDVLMPMDVLGPEDMNKVINRQLVGEENKKHKPKEIIALNDWTRHVLSYQYHRDKNYLKRRNIRYIENSTFDISVELDIIGPYIRIACAEKSEIWGLVIKSDALSKTLQSIFMMQWMGAKPVTSKMVEGWGPSEMLEFQRRRD